MSSRPWPSQRLAVTAFLLAVLVHAPALAQWLTVTSAPDPNRVEPGVTTLTLKGITPGPEYLIGDYSKSRLSVWFLKGDSDMYAVYSPEQTFETGATLSHDFPVPADTVPGKCSAMSVFQIYLYDGSGGPPGWGDLDVVCRDVSEHVFSPKFPGGGYPPITDPNKGPTMIISPPPAQQPPKEGPKPYEPESAGGTLSKPPSSQRPPAAQSARRGAMRSGERLTLRDGRLLVLVGSKLRLFGPRGNLLRSYPPGSEAVISAGGDVLVRVAATSERLGSVRQ